MSLNNYRDISRDAGFQFEFRCGQCSRTWKSTFKPYRRGQLSALIYRFSYYLGDRGGMSRASNLLAQTGSDKAKKSAIEAAQEEAAQHYAECPGCNKVVCEQCWDADAQRCTDCLGGGGSRGGGSRSEDRGGGGRSSGEEGAAGLRCPNCSTAIDGGRFCPECGFDMASTHKSCPSCGALCSRSTRFCTDCGHGF